MKEGNSCSVIVRFDLGLEQFQEFEVSFKGKDVDFERLVAFEGSIHVSEYNSCGVDLSEIND